MASKPTAVAVAAMAVKRLNGPEIPYGSEDCQKFIKECIRMCGGELKGAGTNDIYRNHCFGTMDFSASRPGDLRPGDMLFICKQDGSELQRYQGDGIGNVNHIGIYCGEDGAEVVHSSQSRGRVAASTLRNAWNRRGRLKCLDYEGEEAERIAEEPEDESESEAPATAATPAPSSEPGPGQAMVSTADGHGLNLRKKPDPKGAGIKTMPDGAIVEVLERWGEWAKVRYINWDGMKHEGWCHSGYLQFG